MAIRLLRFARNDMEYRGFWGSLERVLQRTLVVLGSAEGSFFGRTGGLGVSPKSWGHMRLIKAFQASSIDYVAAAIFIRYNISSAATRGEALTEVAVATYLFDDGLHKKRKGGNAECGTT